MPALVLLLLLLLVLGEFVFLHLRPPPGPTKPSVGGPLTFHTTGVSKQDFQAALRRGEVVDADGKPVPASAFPTRSLTFIYFGAEWCAPCQRFTPKLASFCERSGEKRAFNVIMVDEDDNWSVVAKDARAQRLPWAFAKRKSAFETRLMNAYAGKDIPDLVLLDADGKVLDDSFMGATYRGPEAVLDDYRQR